MELAQGLRNGRGGFREYNPVGDIVFYCAPRFKAGAALRGRAHAKPFHPTRVPFDSYAAQ
jgi:hypothetical protein